MKEQYDAVVIGAGPAGGAFATAVARSSRRVLLVERSSWPREKVCGGCLNAGAVRTLERLQLTDGLRMLPLARLELVARSHRAVLGTTGGAAVLRSEMDARLASIAQDSGVEFLTGVSAVVGSRVAGYWRVRLTGREDAEVTAPLVAAADGLNGSSLRELPLPVRTARAAWFGVSAVVTPDATTPELGAVRMHIGRHGYVGMVHLPGGTVNVAAAFDPAWTRKIGGPDKAVGTVLGECAVEWRVGRASFHGSGLLTRRRTRVALPGLLVLGDASGFIEPFTGEGMAWALAGAESASAMVLAGLTGERLAAAWKHWHTRRVRSRQLACSVLRRVVRSPWITGAALGLIGAAPVTGRLAAGVAAALARPYPLPAHGEGSHA